jgi:hypothetical protein
MTESENRAPSVPLRASDAERDAVEALLRHHFAVGRLTLAELEERAAAAYEARTREQLDALVRDLPGEAEEARSQADVVDSRLLIILLCCAPPAALVYWLVSQRAARRRRADLPVRHPRASGETEEPEAP